MANTFQMPLFEPFKKGVDSVIKNNFNSQNLFMNYIRLTQTRSAINSTKDVCAYARINITNFQMCRGVSDSTTIVKDVCLI